MVKHVIYIAVFVVLLVAAGVCYWFYKEKSEKLERLKSREKAHLPPGIKTPEINRNKKEYSDLEKLSLEIENQQNHKISLQIGFILCVVLASLLLTAAIAHSCKEIWRHYPDNLRDCKESCPFLRCFTCSDSDEDTASQMARDVSANYNLTAAREEISVLRRTRSDRHAVQESSADLPGVPED